MLNGSEKGTKSLVQAEETGHGIVCHPFSSKWEVLSRSSCRFKLDYGNHPNKELQREWQEYGEANFSIEVLEKLEYDKDETKTDYSEELALLKMIWEEKLLQRGVELYR